MKKNLLLAVALLCATTASAQIASGRSTSFFSTEKSDQPISFGVRAGLNFNYLNADEGETDAQVGLRLGVVADIPIFESLYFEPGLYFSTRPSKSSVSEDGYKYEEKYTPSYLELPLLLQYRYNFTDDWGVRVNFGPYFAYGLGGKCKESWSGESDSYKLFKKYKEDGDTYTPMKRFDFGLVLGAEAAYRQFTFGINAQFGLANINKDAFGYEDDNGNWHKASIKNSGVYIQLGYNF